MKIAKTKAKPAEKSRGRPRAFDPDQALEAALRVFRKNGYEGASMPELTEAMGINRPSLYAAFGNKEELFRKALDRYIEKTGAYIQPALEQPTSKQVVEALLRKAIGSPGGGKIRGCLLVQGALSCGHEAESIKRELAKRRADTETMLRIRFEQAAAEGDLKPQTSPAALAKYVVTLMHGISVQSSGGATYEDLNRMVDLVMQNWDA